MGAIIRLDERHARAYVAEPDAPPRGRVLLLHDALGLAPHVRFLCDDLTGAGFVAVAPDLFEFTSAETGSPTGPELTARVERVLASALRGFDTLGHTTGRTAAIGFSTGATLALRLALRDVVAAIVLYDIAPSADDAATLPVALLVHLSERAAAGDTAGVSTRLQSNGTRPSHDDSAVATHVYPGTAPRFANADGDTFDLDAAELAWRRTVRFLDRHLHAAWSSTS